MSNASKPKRLKQKPVSVAVMGAVMGLAIAGSPALAADVSGQSIVVAASCSACNPCNPCKSENPCESENPCKSENPCNPCNPCAAAEPCNPCNPCAAD